MITCLCITKINLVSCYLHDFDGATYDISLQLHVDGGLDWNALETAIKPETQCALIQRSCGYSWRKTLTVAEIERAIILIKVSVSAWARKSCTNSAILAVWISK